nr:hypothetical protein [Tanacetum cinerariifolium]
MYLFTTPYLISKKARRSKNENFKILSGSQVASDDLRGALSVIYLSSAHLRCLTKGSIHISHFICIVTITEMYIQMVMLDDAIADKMADVNAPFGQAPVMAPSVHTNDQILPHIRWVPIRKSNCYLDLEKSQGNPIYKIAVDLLKNTNFFKAFTSSSTITSI